ncbi:Hpt domain-containing protein [Marinomonas sp. 15G1-11]|uniref:Hpt domain-containing protein n=1 Tax=Marinomonas phaeophyticola TaxID=3004091 RepID=A0ABT4JT55_9GAMM|nr:Hpt domain-containing protein [Marinomonas sp. 15G1-11]MCZ2720779.1 Hpt domain-containing protein [Marinomonas sp. 15G1-11]
MFKIEVGKDNDQILEFVHTLKSSAAYIGAFELSTSCSILEEALLNGNGTNAFLVSVLHSLDRYIGQLSPLFENELSQKTIPKSGYPDSNVGKLKEVLIELLPLLQTSDFSAENYFDSLHSLVANTEHVSLVGELVWNVEEVEYERAAEIVQRLLAQIQGTQ